MKDLDFYKAEVLKRIDAKRETVREKRRSALSLAYPLALLFTCLLFFFPGIRTVGPDRPTPSTNYFMGGKTFDSPSEYPGSSEIALPSIEQFFHIPETLLGEKTDPGFGGSSHPTDSAAHMKSQPQFNQIGGSETDALRYGEAVRFDLAGGVPEILEPSKGHYGGGTDPRSVLPLHRAFLRAPAAVLITRTVSLFRWQTGNGAYLFVAPAEKSGKVTFLLPILCEVISDAKPIPRRLTEETLAALPPTEEEA